jgi:phosphate transport system protein
MSWKNVLSLFRKDDLYTQALAESHQMLDIDLKMFEASVESLRRYDDGTMPVDVYAMDKQVNRFERDVRRKVMTHLTVSGPADVASGLVLVSVVIDIERIGDYAKNIYDLARWHPRRLDAGSLEAEVSDIETRVADLFRQMVDAFKASDVDKARRSCSSTRRSSRRLRAAGHAHRLRARSPTCRRRYAATLVLYIRYLKRIAAHRATWSAASSTRSTASATRKSPASCEPRGQALLPAEHHREAPSRKSAARRWSRPTR